MRLPDKFFAGLSILAVSLFLATDMATAAVSVENLRVETRKGPVTIDLPHPRFSWEIISDSRGTMQKYYRIIVASSPENLKTGKGDLWDSGKIRSDVSVDIPYNGKKLADRMTCYWKVKVWCGKAGSAWSDVSAWHTGLMDEKEWKAQWIGLDRYTDKDSMNFHSRLSARYLRKEFPVYGNIRDARLYITGLGLYELYVNGHNIGNQVLSPSPTDFTQEVKYSEFDLKPFLNKGQNAVGVILGNGMFFAMHQKTKPWKIRTFGFPKLLFQLELTMIDGSKRTIVSDNSWKVNADGPIISDNYYDGEEYDATKEFKDWTKPGFDDTMWRSADITSDPCSGRRFFAEEKPQKNEPKTPHGNLDRTTAMKTAQINENMKIMKAVKPVSVSRLGNSYIIDMGQNMAGWLRIRVKGEKGDKVSLHFAESLKPDGSIYTDNLRSARATDTYTLKGEGTEVWEPRFVYHGFRYVEVSGWPGEPSIDNFEGEVIYDGIPNTGTFESSDSTLNAIFKNSWWGIAGNYKGMPVDCPQRDERQPWLGDRSVGSYGESFLFDNQRLYEKWLDDIKESMSQEGQIPDVAPNYINYYTDNLTWPGTYLMVASMLYHQYADAAAVWRHYPSMKKWMDYMKSRYLTPEFIMNKDSYGDWCMPPESPELIHSKDPARITDGSLIATAYYYKFLKLMQEFAGVLGKNEDMEEFAALSAKVAESFQNRFYNKQGKFYGNNTVTANILPLAFGLFPKADSSEIYGHVKKVFENNGCHVCTGIIGIAWLMRTLSACGGKDLAYRIASNKTYPGWGYMVENGATTIWELWNGNTADPSMNSQNHVMLLGDLLVWYYENLAGIKSAPDAPGFKRIIMNPDFQDGLSYVNASYKSVYGLIRSSWKKDGGTLEWKIEIPANTEAEVYIPALSATSVFEGGIDARKSDGVSFVRMENGRAIFKVGSGSYYFSAK